jgi:hypothetical protein
LEGAGLESHLKEGTMVTQLMMKLQRGHSHLSCCVAVHLSKGAL